MGDAILSAPQKGWTGPACSSVIMLGERGTHATRNTTSTSMVINMRKWLEVMDSYAGNFTFRIGLFGLDKVVNKDRTISILEEKLVEILPEIEKAEAEKTA